MSEEYVYDSRILSQSGFIVCGLLPGSVQTCCEVRTPLLENVLVNIEGLWRRPAAMNLEVGILSCGQ